MTLQQQKFHSTHNQNREPANLLEHLQQNSNTIQKDAQRPSQAVKKRLCDIQGLTSNANRKSIDYNTDLCVVNYQS